MHETGNDNGRCYRKARRWSGNVLERFPPGTVTLLQKVGWAAAQGINSSCQIIAVRARLCRDRAWPPTLATRGELHAHISLNMNHYASSCLGGDEAVAIGGLGGCWRFRKWSICFFEAQVQAQVKAWGLGLADTVLGHNRINCWS